MNRGVWIAALAVGLGGLLSKGSGQEVVWRALQPGKAPLVVRGVAADPPASIGQPLVIARGTTTNSEPLPFPPAYQTGAPVIPAPPSPGVESIAAVPPPGSVIATSVTAAHLAPLRPAARTPVTAPVRSEAEVTPGDLFAADRGNIAQGPGQPIGALTSAAFVGFPEAQWQSGPEILPIANWESVYPVDQPPVAPPLPDAGPFPSEQPLPRFYFSGEYLLWWIRPDHAPPLATTGDAQQGGLAGALGMPSTVILDNGQLTQNPFSGGRFTVGYYLDCDGNKAIEVTGFFLGQNSRNFTASSSQYPVLARPFFNVNAGIPFVQQVAFPGVASGTLTINSPSSLGGVAPNLRCKWCCGCDYQVYVLAGLRYLTLNESVTITEDIQTLPGVLADPFNGTHLQVVDSFATHNQFYGGQVGVDGRWQWKRFTVDGTAMLALGFTEESLDVNGAFHFPPGTPNVSSMPGGLLALNSNIGHFTRSAFAVVPEVGVKLGYYLTQNIRATVGYNFLYWSNVVRPGEQIDSNLDVTRIPNFVIPAGTPPAATPQPAPLFRQTDIWAQGLTVGIEFNY